MLTWIIVFKKTCCESQLAEKSILGCPFSFFLSECPGGGGGELLELLESSSRGPVEASIRLAGRGTGSIGMRGKGMEDPQSRQKIRKSFSHALLCPASISLSDRSPNPDRDVLAVRSRAVFLGPPGGAAPNAVWGVAGLPPGTKPAAPPLCDEGRDQHSQRVTVEFGGAYLLEWTW